MSTSNPWSGSSARGRDGIARPPSPSARFVEFARDLYRALEAPAPAVPAETDLPLAMEIEIDDVYFEIAHDPELNPEAVVVRCGLGILPEAGAAEAMHALLQGNQRLFRTQASMFCIDERDSRATYAFQLPLESAHAGALLARMGRLADGVARWRADFDPEPLVREELADLALGAPGQVEPGRRRWLELVRALPAANRLLRMTAFESDPAGPATASFSILDSRFTLFHAPGFGSRFILECAIGVPPSAEHAETLHHYLGLNHGLADLGRVGFCIDAADGQVCHAAREDVADHAGASLLDKVRQNWQLKRDRWRETRLAIHDEEDTDFDSGKVFSMARVPPTFLPIYA